MTIKTHSHDSGMLQTRFAPSVNYEYQVNMCMDFSPQYRFAPTGPSTHWSLWGGTCGNKKNNPTGKLVETVEVLDMTPPVSTLWDVLPLLRRFPKTKKRISWVVISIEYKKPLHIYIYIRIFLKKLNGTHIHKTLIFHTVYPSSLEDSNNGPLLSKSCCHHWHLKDQLSHKRQQIWWSRENGLRRLQVIYIYIYMCNKYAISYVIHTKTRETRRVTSDK